MPEATPSPDAPQSSPEALCLHCKVQPATKVEGINGFTLCDGCYFDTGIDDSNFMQLPPRTAQDRLIAVLMAENERLRRALYACERILSGGEA